jgi:Uma2 family endonuclease
MAKLLERPANYSDLLKVPDNLVAELVDGELFTSPRPSFRHSRATSRLAALLTRAFEDGIDGPAGWWILVEPELHLRGDVLVPDIAGWRRESMPEFPDVVASDVAPDWVCEVLSPRTSKLDRFRKLPKYALNEIEHVWIVDPNNRTLDVYRRAGATYEMIQVFEEDEQPIVRAEPFDAIEFPLATLWPPTAPDPRN